MNEFLQTIIAKIKQLLNSSPAPVVQAVANKPAASTEPAPIAVPINRPSSATQAAVVVAPKIIKQDNTDNLPQDSTLRRHAIAHLRSLIESINPGRPTDSSLSRHYDALINAEIEQCISDKGAIERLVVTVEAHKKALAQPVTAPIEPVVNSEISVEETVVQAEATVLEETAVEANSPLPPTDSTLRRHYDTMIDNELNSLLEGK
ncbi:MAG: hypothetical protein WCS87_02180 [Methylococcaceae bacterium]